MDALVLGPGNTRAVEHLHQRLALGVQWVDALTGQPAEGRWVSRLDAIGPRPVPLSFTAHPLARHSQVHAGRLAAILKKAAAEKVATPPADPADDTTNFKLSAWGETTVSRSGYVTGNDPRRYVPRRLSLTPAQAGGVPTDTAENIRLAQLWPGAAYPVQGGSTLLRGRIRRGTPAEPVAWARIVITRPNGLPNFNTEARLGHAHGDDRGEFLAVFGPAAVPGGVDLPAGLALRVWVFLPPLATSFDPADPLASLPLEFAGLDARNAVLDGTAPPSGYLRQDPIDLTAPLGRATTLTDAQLSFT
jgi:hypothetical protein